MKKKSLQAHEVASAFAALGSEQRLEILTTLVRAGPNGLSTGEIGDKSGVSGSTLTHHLKILSAANLVQQKKNGRTIICTAAEFEQVEQLSLYLLRECCADATSKNKHGKHKHA